MATTRHRLTENEEHGIRELEKLLTFIYGEDPPVKGNGEYPGETKEPDHEESLSR